MKFTQAFTSLGLFAGALAAPALESTRGPQTANFLFQCEGDSSYKMGIVVDGETFKTEHDLVVHSIEVNDFNAQQQCKFKGDDGVLIETSLEIDYETGEQKLVLEEPQTVRSFSCEGICVGINGQCSTMGTTLAPCCNGFCAATKCRPWNQNTSE